MPAKSFQSGARRAADSAEAQVATFARRLWSEMEQREVSIAELAAAVTADPRTVRMWRDGSHLPKGRELWLIAQRLDVTVDWLLGRGRDDVPERPGRRRSETYLLRELTAHLRAAALAGIQARFPSVAAHHLRLDGEALLAEFTAATVARAEQEAERLQGRLEAAALGDVVSAALRKLSIIAATTLSRADQLALARVMKEVERAERRLQERATWADGDPDPTVGLRSSDGLAVPAIDMAPLRRLEELNMMAAERGPAAPLRSAQEYLEEAERLSEADFQEALAKARAAGDERAERVLSWTQNITPLPETPLDADEREDSRAEPD